MAGLLLVALSLPLAVVFLGVVQMRPKPATPVPEIAPLRESAEAAAAEVLPLPELSDGRRKIVLAGTPEENIHRRALVEEAARGAGGTALVDGDRILVHVPAEQAGTFEISALLPAVEAGQERTGVYDIQLTAP